MILFIIITKYSTNSFFIKFRYLDLQTITIIAQSINNHLSKHLPMTEYIIGKTNYRTSDSTANYYRAKHILEFLKNGSKTSREIINEIGFEHSVKIIIKALYRDGLITMIKKDGKFPYTLTERGQRYLEFK